MPQLPQTPDRRPVAQRWGLLLLLLLAVAMSVALIRAPRERGRSNLARTPYSHSFERAWRLDEDGKWVLEFEAEQWQTGGDKWPEVRQWQVTKRTDTGAITYWYWGGGRNRNLTYSTATGKLAEGAAVPIFHHWDWEHMLGQEQTFGTLDRQSGRTLRGRKMRIYRLTTSDEGSETEQTFYIDAKTGLTVREEGIMRPRISEEQASTEKLAHDIDYDPFAPDELFDIHALAHQPEA